LGSSWVARSEGDLSDKPRLFNILRLHRQAADDGATAEAFLNQARRAKKLKHANIATILETSVSDGEVFAVSDYVPGEPLAMLLERAGTGGLPSPVALRIGVDVLDALLAAHSLHPEPIVHGEINPWN